MKKVFQSNFDKDLGDCWPAAIASLLNLHLEDIPHFNMWHDQGWNVYFRTLEQYGYTNITTLYNPFRKFIDPRYPVPDDRWSFSQLKHYKGVDGYFYATVWSPIYIKYGLHKTHAVIIDKEFNVVHDPNPFYQNRGYYPGQNTLGFNGVLHIEVIEKI